MIAVQIAVLAAFALTCQSVNGSPDKTALYKAAFEIADTNNDNKVSKDELFALLKKYDSGVSDADLENTFAKVDENKSGDIDFDEFMKFAQGEGIEAVFRVYDQDKNGFITKEELRKVLADNGIEKSDDEISIIIQGADKNKDGVISVQELKESIKSSQ